MRKRCVLITVLSQARASLFIRLPSLLQMVKTLYGQRYRILYLRGPVFYLAQAIKSEMSPLQREMVNVTKIVTLIAITLGVIFFFLGFSIAGLTFAESFIFAIGIIVANVPEGLLPTVSLSLAMGV